MTSQPAPKQRALMIVLIVIGILFTAFFGLRAFRAFIRFSGHRPPPPPGNVETDVELIRDWMTVPFISRMYHVPEEIIFNSLDIPARKNRDKSLNEINEEYFPDANGVVLETVKATVLANLPTPAPPLAP